MDIWQIALGFLYSLYHPLNHLLKDLVVNRLKDYFTFDMYLHLPFMITSAAFLFFLCGNI
jgi:hypothetical protein